MGPGSHLEKRVFKGRGNLRILNSEGVVRSRVVWVCVQEAGANRAKGSCKHASQPAHSLLYGIEHVLQHGRYRQRRHVLVTHDPTCGCGTGHDDFGLAVTLAVVVLLLICPTILVVAAGIFNNLRLGFCFSAYALLGKWPLAYSSEILLFHDSPEMVFFARRSGSKLARREARGAVRHHGG